ncbi:MAG: hypothetical protein M3163_13965 [Actinomycetota bacterium]|nr:hypothetical protein [Actinomycetota bacterium]
MKFAVGFVLGQHPSSRSVLREVFEHLRRAGAGVSTWVCSDGGPVPEELAEARAVALRGPNAQGLDVARRLEAAGARCCNAPEVTARASDKAVVVDALTSAGVPVPPSVLVSSWGDVLVAAGAGPIVVKMVDGSGGTGVLLAGPEGLPVSAPFPGPFLVQERLSHDGPDRKIFVVGPRIWGLLRPWPASRPADKLGRPFDPTPEDTVVAAAAGRALGLEVFGVDLVPTPRGPVVVDVNPFPGFKGVDGAALAIAGRLLTLARAEFAA